ncbi:MAG: DUF2789 domain-containing protein [Bacteroidota bacterium]
MERPVHDLSNLFAQLGQPCDEQDIESFIDRWRPLGGGIQLHEAAFWTPAQAAFLREAIVDDADWAEAVDTLNVKLHQAGSA